MSALTDINIFLSIREGESFTDQDLAENSSAELHFQIIGDHLYAITDGENRVILASDLGNGHGAVISITELKETKRVIRAVRVTDDIDSSCFMYETDMTAKEIRRVLNDCDSPELEGLGYDDRMKKYAEDNGLHFKSIGDDIKVYERVHV